CARVGGHSDSSEDIDYW
nr:immunoglobulin heavy chain junction region [Macaca mulatta]MOW45898.1 immunoglobulin heavy chain junction region [Macaca mulatta]MOW46140.1 immunoglobulin heavy chain junction region [Macaca mulatta]MOW46143.1 immunoglobulin heavy chain junction region [Macaca mulatta]MOW46213.1 immunoglobulin heavy chain junction region [Macaca mulatta]